MPAYYEADWVRNDEHGMSMGVVCEFQRHWYDTWEAYGHAMSLMMENPDFTSIYLTAERGDIARGWYYLFQRSGDKVEVYAHTPNYREKITTDNICDYFRRPVRSL